ncbi:MAG: hypothetical protein NC489_35720 [Ruminococcus flavefaciens]|nr:hypothetical protein [Ruminococcus flavefaciens]
MNWAPSRTEDFYRAMFSSFALAMKPYQSKDNKRIGLSIKDDKGNFKIGSILGYKKPDDASEEDDTGNWYLQMTFNEEDMTDLTQSTDNHSDVFIRCMYDQANNICYGRFRTVESMYTMINTAIDELTKFLDANATDDGEPVDVTLRGYFTASVGVENGVKVMSVVPGEFVKQLVKEDYAL